MTQDQSSLAARLAELESRYTLLARTVEELDEVVVGQARQIEQLQRRIKLLASGLTALSEPPEEPLTLEDEKPPHY